MKTPNNTCQHRKTVFSWLAQKFSTSPTTREQARLRLQQSIQRKRCLGCTKQELKDEQVFSIRRQIDAVTVSIARNVDTCKQIY